MQFTDKIMQIDIVKLLEIAQQGLWELIIGGA